METMDQTDESVAKVPLTTICTCDIIGPISLQTSHMTQYGLMRSQIGIISLIVTGADVSLSLFDNVNFQSDADKTVIGPSSTVPLQGKHLDGDDDFADNSISSSWNDKIKSLVIMAWNPCPLNNQALEEVIGPCGTTSTQSPVQEPTSRR